MKDKLDELKGILKDPDNRTIIRILKWVCILGAFCIPGLLGLFLALVLIFSWKIPG